MIVISANTAWYIYNFRLNLIAALLRRGERVVVLAPADNYINQLEDVGCEWLPLPKLDARTNPFNEFFAVAKIFVLLNQLRPEVVFSFTAKPNLYFGVSCRLLDIPFVPNVSGRGSGFEKKYVGSLLQLFYRVALRRAAKVFFQNNEDLDFFCNKNLVDRNIVERLPGSGVDTDRFKPSVRANIGPIRVLMSCRLLMSKGVQNFLAAAEEIKKQELSVEFLLLGGVDVAHPDAVPLEVLNKYSSSGIVTVLGHMDNVLPTVQSADLFVLPSYYNEGVPRSLLEAASCAVAIITSDSVGCRDTLKDGETGFLCRPRDTEDLRETIVKAILLGRQKLSEMGYLGRQFVKQEFCESRVIGSYLQIHSVLVDKSPELNSE